MEQNSNNNNTPEDFLSSLKHGEANDIILSQDHEKLAGSITDVIAASGNEKLSPDNKIKLWQNILADLPAPETRHQTITPLLWRWYAAAAILVFFSIGVYFVSIRQAATVQLAKQNVTPLKNDILPGSNKAILTLANGSEIILDNAQKGLLSKQGQTLVNKTAKGQVTYQQADKTPGTAMVNFNTITTPRGGQYQIILPDGTKAWLNAASSLRFPTAFTGKERDVALTGEVYFEVAKNKAMPFRISINGAKVEVLGTHFNVMAYPDEKEIKTTLLEGSVKVSKNGGAVFLKPGQQALLDNATGNIKVQPADIDAAIAWQKGYYLFKQDNIRSIMRSLSRWYDVDIDYKGDFDDKDFSGTVSRLKNISEVLRLLELTDDVHFKIEGRRITVMP